jgi:DNA-binding transcriptional LysR family regulator
MFEVTSVTLVGRHVVKERSNMQVVRQPDIRRADSRPVRPLELRQYRYFVVLAEELHFARAAERLNIGQSNLSREIRSLEQQIGLRLFYRTSRRTELSAAGERLLRQARHVLAAEEHARLAIGEFKRSAKERLRIGICERVACSRMASALADWRRANPDVLLQIVTRSGRALLGELEAGLLDAGITAMRINEPGMVADQLWTDAWVAAVPRNHSLASARAIEPADLARERLSLLAPDPICSIEQQIIERMQTESTFFIAERPSTASALMTWVEAGCGVGLLTASQGEGVVHANVIVRPLRCGLPPAVVYLLRSDAPPSPQLSGLIACLRAPRP